MAWWGLEPYRAPVARASWAEFWAGVVVILVCAGLVGFAYLMGAFS